VTPLDFSRRVRAGGGLSPRDALKRLAVAAAVLALHLGLGLLIVLGMRERSLPVPAARPIEMALERDPVKIRLPLPIPKLVAPKLTTVSPPPIDIAPAPQSALSQTPQGIMPSAPGGGGNGNGGQGTVAAAKPPADPNCETIDAYKDRVHRAIERYSRYPTAAQSKFIQGVVTLHFVSNAAGRVLVHAVAASRIVRTYRIAADYGRPIAFTFTFTRIGANQWGYEVVTQTTEKTPHLMPLPGGTLRAEAGGVLNPDRLIFEIPPSVIATGDGKMVIPLGSAPDLFLLEDRVNQAIEDAQPLPAIPACLKFQSLNALMPFGFELQVPGVLLPSQN
jgi:hypothetical protein